MSNFSISKLLAIVLTLVAVAYIAWKVSQSPDQALQFAFNGVSVGAIYALLAMGFTLVYSTVWFFDLYYGAAAAIGAYGVFYLRSSEALGGRYEVNEAAVNVGFAVVTAGVVAWVLHTSAYRRFRARFGATVPLAGIGLLAGARAHTSGSCFPFPLNCTSFSLLPWGLRWRWRRSWRCGRATRAYRPTAMPRRSWRRPELLRRGWGLVRLPSVR